MVTEKLQAVDQHCPKCLSPEVNVVWCSPIDEETAAVMSDMAGAKVQPAPEIMRLTCRRCRFGWSLAPADSYPDPGPCPLCGGTEYVVNWIDAGTSNDPFASIPGSISCPNPDCPPMPDQS